MGARIFSASIGTGRTAPKTRLMDIVQPSRLDLVGDVFRMYLGAYWLQPFIYFEQPTASRNVAMITAILSATSTGPSGNPTGPTYEVQLADDSRILKPLISLDSQLWAVGDWVVVQELYGTWTICDPGEAQLEDLSTVLRAILQVRDRANGRVILTFDSEDAGDATKPSIRLSPSLSTSLELYAPPQAKIAPSVYEYDLFFYYSNVEPYGAVKRQFGQFEIYSSITQRR